MPSPPVPAVRYRHRLLRAGEFRLDGGSMFGLIPRTVWSRSVPTDDKGRITVQHNCLLLERVGEAPTNPDGSRPFSPKLVLLEAGTGDKLDDKSRDLFAMQPRTILDALHEANCSPDDVGAAIVSHLHFDHAGGLTRLARPGETPDWQGPASGMAGQRPDHGVKRSFPNARIVTQRREWDDALANRSVMTRTYFRDHLEPLKDHLLLADSPAPFEPWRTPDRAESPLLRLDQRAVEVLPGIRVLRTPGHTWGQQATIFTDDRGRTVVFTPDVLPTAAHAGATYSLAYDVEPYTTMITKAWFLRHAADENWLLMLDHEPGDPFRRVRANDKGWFDLIAENA
jgi:glyoxylase-like metal-dependent hydrolase (beta-lactamase superfamily II)